MPELGQLLPITGRLAVCGFSILLATMCWELSSGFRAPVEVGCDPRKLSLVHRH